MRALGSARKSTSLQYAGTLFGTSRMQAELFPYAAGAADRACATGFAGLRVMMKRYVFQAGMSSTEKRLDGFGAGGIWAGLNL